MKRVHFSTEVHQTHFIVKHCECRNGIKWILLANDRLRFKRHINNINNLIGYIFSSDHRHFILLIIEKYKKESNL